MSDHNIYNPPLDCGLDIIFRDQYLVVVNKPAGLLSVPGRGEDKLDSLATRVQSVFANALVAHRLDRDTSGLILFPLGADLHRRVSLMFEKREMSKRYIAIVLGKPELEQGEVNLPLIVDWPNRPRQMVDHQDGKPALTRYTVLKYDPSTRTSRVSLEPVTGRTHQLRVHMSAIGHPILGDTLYGGSNKSNLINILHLHAHTLSFIHPFTGAKLDLISEPSF
jgi:tRNA pseudouridine32 synthase / 23S rRNA pseudouridine746 synthase